MDFELPSGMIQDIDVSMLLQYSDDSDSLDELVIKDFSPHVVESEPDASLPITVQALIESNKLQEAIESVKQRFQVKVARDKTAERGNQQIQVPKTQNISPILGKVKQIIQKPQLSSNIDGNINQIATRATPVSIIDTENWGGGVLDRPLIDQIKPVEDQLGSTSEEDFLNESDMQFDDHFGVANVLEPTSFANVPPRHQQPKNHETSRNSIDSLGNVEDLENPQFGDLPSDESVNYDISANAEGNIESFEDPQFPSDTSSIDHNLDSAVEKSKVDSVHETQHDRDIKKLKELLDNGTLTSSVTNQRFEEGVLDLLLRQSDSLWDPVVAGEIPITHFIPSRNYEKCLLDTSIDENNLHSPLIKKPVPKLPAYMESLENELTTNITPADIDVDMNNNTVTDYENVLVEGLPKFSYEPAQRNLYRKKIRNIMDSEDEADDSVDILDDDEMNYDDLVNNAAEPTYDFKKAQLLDDLEIKLRLLERQSNNVHRNSSQPESRPCDLEVFNQNRHQFNALFGFVQNGTINNQYVASNEIETMYKNTPAIDNRIMRDVDNCQHHFQLMKSIYAKIIQFMSQAEQPVSSQMHNNFAEIMKTFNKIKDGRICARLPACPTENSVKTPNGIRDRIDVSPQKKPTQKTEVNPTQNLSQYQHPIQNPVKIRKSVSFADSVEENGSVANTKSKSSNKSQQKQGVDNDSGLIVKKWTTLNIKEVKDLIEHARLAQGKYKSSTNGRSQQKTRNSHLKRKK